MATTAAEHPLTRGCITELSKPAITLNQLQGAGVVFNKSLVVPFHFGQTVNSVEYVQVQPASSVGEHVQDVDEIYFITAGKGELTTNGEISDVGAGDLILAPRFTRHTIRNTNEHHSLDFLVIEVKTRSYVSCTPLTIIDLYSRLQPTETLFPAWRGPGGQRVAVNAFTIDLMQHFTGGWSHLSLVELPAGCRIKEYTLPNVDENLLIYGGVHATIEVDGYIFHTDEESVRGLNAYVPAGIARSIINRSSVDPLRILSVRFHQERD